jgi:ABC-type multidrug transport system ATPase subunit
MEHRDHFLRAEISGLARGSDLLLTCSLNPPNRGPGALDPAAAGRWTVSHPRELHHGVRLWPNLTGGEVIDLLGSLRGGLDPARRAQLLDRFVLDPTKRCRAYSKGNRQKVALVAAFASDVELYLLDEPTSGLDPLMEAVFQDVVRELREAGRTVLLSSHILSEVEALCDRVTIVRAGRAAETGTFDQLRHLTRTSVVVQTARPVDGLGALPGVHDVSVDGSRTRFTVDAGELNAVLARLVDLDVRTLVSSPPTLEELFLRHYGEDIGAGHAGTELAGVR